jgi:hypothetical protein
VYNGLRESEGGRKEESKTENVSEEYGNTILSVIKASTDV